MKLKLTSANEENLQEYIKRLSSSFTIEKQNINNFEYYTIELDRIEDIVNIIECIEYRVVIEDGILFPLNLIIYDDYID